MIRLASGGSATEAVEALMALGACGDRSAETLAVFRDSLTAKSPAVRAAAAEAILSLAAPLPPGIQPKAGARRDQNPTVRIAAAFLSLQDAEDPGQVLEEVASELSTAAPADRAFAARVLGTAGPAARGFLRELLPLLKDGNEEVRRQALEAVERVVGW